MGLFEELDIAGADDNPWLIPDNTYQAVVSDLRVAKDRNENMGMTFVYKITDGDYSDREVTEYKRMPHSTDKDQLQGAEKEKAKSYIKMRLASLGIPEERMNDVEKDDLIGIDCYITVKNNKGYTNINNVTLTSDVQSYSSASAGGADPFQ